MDLRHIRAFLAVADTGNFTRAAANLRLAQPSLSQQILNLEQSLGQPLFHRMGRRSSLTAAGERFLSPARAVILAADLAFRSLQDDPVHPAGVVRLGTVPTIGPYLLPALIRRTAAVHPEIHIESREEFAAPLIEEVLAGELDFALLPRTAEDPRLIQEPILQEPLLLLLPKDHRLARAREVATADLQDESLILLGDKTSLSVQVRRFLGKNAVAPRILHRCCQVGTVKALIAAGAGVAVLPLSVQDSPLDAGLGLVWRSLADTQPMREVQLVRHPARYLSSAALAVQRLLHEVSSAQRRIPVPASGNLKKPRRPVGK
jgi:LysR family hydrogen peroxide-inducible transcriptional activator